MTFSRANTSAKAAGHEKIVTIKEPLSETIASVARTSLGPQLSVSITSYHDVICIATKIDWFLLWPT